MSKASDSHAIAQRYTTALFELAEEAKKLKPVATELEAMKTLFAESEEFVSLCNAPTISADERKAALEAIVKKAKSSPLVKKFLNTLAENGRLNLLPEVINDFIHRMHEKNDELVAEVTTAVEMKKTQMTKLEKMLKAHFGKKVALDVQVNEQLLGGLRIRVDGQLIDASVSGRMQRLTSHLNSGIQQIV